MSGEFSVMPDAGRAADGPAPTADAGESESFFEVSIDLLVIRDLDGKVIKASRSWATTLGRHPHEMEGQPLLDLVHPEDMPATLAGASEVMNRKPGDPVLGFTNRYRHKDGSYRTLEWRAQRRGDRIYGVARDVTQRAAAARAGAALSDVTGIIDALLRTDLTPEQAEMVSFIREAVAQGR